MSQNNTDTTERLEFLWEVINSLPVEIVVRDADSLILLANSEFCAIQNQTPEEIIGQRDADIWASHGRPQEQIAEWQAEDREIIATGAAKEYIQEIRRESGETVYFHNLKKRLTLPDGSHYVLAMYTEITERKRMEDQLRRARDQAAELSGIHKTSVTYAHEISNPLTGVLALVQVLLEGEQCTAEAKAQLKEIQVASERIRDVIRKIDSLREPKTRHYLDRPELLDLREDK
jgi:PAS domain S-box-containing protein